MSESAEADEHYRMWGGRFTDLPDPRASLLLTSLPVDRALLRWDLLGSLAHLTALAEAHVIPAQAASALGRSLRELLTECEGGALPPAGGHEDVHSFVEATLASRLGPVAGWLHAGRSRNDQVVTAFRMALKDRIRRLVGKATGLQDALLARARDVTGVLLPAYTHLQRAQPVSLAHHWLAYFWMLGRDIGRLRDAYRRIDVMPLGSGAIAGAGFPVDRSREAALLGFAQISENSVDATGDRDFVVEALAAIVSLTVHLSRWAEELVLWCTQEFSFVSLPEALMTGSSIMPQKRNPDLLELVRAQAGVALGPLVTLAAILKGLPAGYNRDLQEDKAPMFTALDAADAAVDAMTLAISRLTVHTDRMEAALRGGYLTATEVADYLVRRGVPFRQAHDLAGKAVLAAEAAGCELWELPLAAYKKIAPEFDEDVLQAATPSGAVAAKDVPGGTAPARVMEALEAARAVAVAHRSWVEQAAATQTAAEARLLAAAPS